MTELSLCMIVKNEEERLARCLSGVQGAVDEIIIVDTGSTDGTKRVAGQFTNRVYDYAWDDDFFRRAQRVPRPRDKAVHPLAGRG